MIQAIIEAIIADMDAQQVFAAAMQDGVYLQGHFQDKACEVLRKHLANRADNLAAVVLAVRKYVDELNATSEKLSRPWQAETPIDLYVREDRQRQLARVARELAALLEPPAEQEREGEG